MEDAAIIKQQARLLYQQAPFSNLTVISVSWLFALLFWQHEQGQLLVIWSTAITVFSCVRLLVWWQFNRRPELLNPRQWLKIYTLLTLLVGIAWGSTSMFYFLIDDIQINTLFYILISAVIAAAVPVLAASFSTFLAYTVPPVLMLTSITAYQIFTQAQWQALPYFLLFGLYAYFGFMLSLARRANRNIIDGLKLQEKNQALLDDLSWEVAQRESMIESRTTELREANQQLSENRAHMVKLSSAVEASPNGIMITNREGIIEYVNPRSEQISGYSLQESIGKTPRLFKSAFTTKGACKSMWRTIMDGQEWVGELENKRKNGEAYWARIYVAPIKNQQQQITHFVAIQEDVTEARALASELSHRVRHDDLTGLINRSEFERRLADLVAETQHSDAQHALCFLDLDQFKVINDTCGHIAGDELLRQLSLQLGNLTRKHDTLARLGGDEFGILMEHCDVQQASRVADDIRKVVESFQFVWESQIFTIGVSIGMTRIDQQTVNATEILKQADSACFAAKRSGRNCVYLYQDDDAQLVEQAGEFRWVNEIKEALNQSRMALFVQPIISLQAGRKQRYEVLVRLRTRQGKLIMPGAFLPTAERFNLSERVDRWVIDEAINWLNKYHQQLPDIEHLAINLSGASLGNRHLLEHIVQMLSNAQFKPQLISFEITETAAIANLREATFFINSLTELGCQFALDDFGSGLSSFGYLKNLPVNAIKIDGMFVRDIIDDPFDAEMVKAINDIGHVMKLETIAEFVENAEILSKLQEIGVDFVQGFHLGKPQPIDGILDADNANQLKSWHHKLH
ncbi:MAG: EAL domain-containing protein [Methylophaga sp.]